MKFKTGDKVRCINDSYIFDITEGCNYTVETAKENFVRIIGAKGLYADDRFTLIKSTKKKGKTMNKDQIEAFAYNTLGEVKDTEEVTIFTTSDGETFTNSGAADSHEVLVTFFKELQNKAIGIDDFLPIMAEVSRRL